MAYTYPRYVPSIEDEFGFDVDADTPDWPAEWTNGAGTSAKAGSYYTDPDHPDSTDSGNPNGHPDLPRKTPVEASALGPGAIAWIESGVFGPSVSTGTRFNWAAAATSEAPAFLTGNPLKSPEEWAEIQDTVHISETSSCNFLVIQYLRFTRNPTGGQGWIDLRPGTGFTIEHVIIRHVVMAGNGVDTITAINVGNGPAGTFVRYVVIYDADISGFGNPNPGSTDACGVLHSFRSSYVWTLDCHIHHIGADAVAGCHGATEDNKPHHIFVGRCIFHENGENGVDFKALEFVVVSETTVFGPFAREQGWGIVLHGGGPNALPTKNAIICFNHIFTCAGGIYGTTTGGSRDIYIFGNIIHDIKAEYAETVDQLNGACVHFGQTAGNVWIVDNTFYDYEVGVSLMGIDPTDTPKLHGNIFQGRSDPNGVEISIKSTGQQAYCTTDYNLYPVGARFYWGSLTAVGLAVVQASGQDAHSEEGDALFADVDTADFSLLSGSDAENASVEGPVGATIYDHLTANFPEFTSKTDFIGGTRPAGGAWDKGALERGAVVEVDLIPPTPNPATIASITVDSPTQITVVATTATDAGSPAIEYNHARNGVYAGWQSSATRVFSGLNPLTTYSFRVKSRDGSDNETTQSEAQDATTAAPPTPPSPAPLGNRNGVTTFCGIF